MLNKTFNGLNTLTSKEAAERLGVSVGRIRQLVVSGELPAEKFGRDLMIKDADLDSIKVYGKPGRPPKPKDEGEPAEATATAAPETAEAVTTEAKPKRTRKAKAAKPTRAGKKKQGV
ncbi:MAG: helix-turn-helix domain-containing protein [Acidobacteria bacterium]|nr:helix-turn-helix domain-containing protein [Acidobacteriota bacterium]